MAMLARSRATVGHLRQLQRDVLILIAVGGIARSEWIEELWPYSTMQQWHVMHILSVQILDTWNIFV